MTRSVDEKFLILFLHEYCKGSPSYASRTFERETGFKINPNQVWKFWGEAGISFGSHGAHGNYVLIWKFMNLFKIQTEL